MSDSFEEIVFHLQQELGPMEVDHPVEMVITITLETRRKIVFTADVFTSAEAFCLWLNTATEQASYLQLKDVTGTHHMIRSDQVIHAEIEVEDE